MDMNEYGLSNENWREDPDTLTCVIVLSSGFKAKQYDVLLAVEQLTPFIAKKFERRPNDQDIEIFCCMIMGE